VAIDDWRFRAGAVNSIPRCNDAAAPGGADAVFWRTIEMRNITCAIVSAALAGALAACAGGSVTPAYLGTYDPSKLNYAASKGPIYTEIVGNPFGVPDADVAGAVTSAMFGAHFGQNVRFTTTRDPENASPYRVVVLFNPARGVAPQDLCADPRQPSEAAGDVLRVMAVFCAGASRETSLTGRVAGVRRTDDPAFRHLIRQMTAQLFPPINPDLLNDADVFDL
jgi:hypothetical protein